MSRANMPVDEHGAYRFAKDGGEEWEEEQAFRRIFSPLQKAWDAEVSMDAADERARRIVVTESELRELEAMIAKMDITRLQDIRRQLAETRVWADQVLDVVDDALTRNDPGRVAPESKT